MPPKVKLNPDGTAVLLDDDEAAVLLDESALPAVPAPRPRVVVCKRTERRVVARVARRTITV